MAQETEGSRGAGKPFVERISLWIGVLGSIITILLTVWNAQTKAAIDKREADLKTLEVGLKQRSTGVEESKERVERYKNQVEPENRDFDLPKTVRPTLRPYAPFHDRGG
jgi:hypothetical protein